MCGILGDITTHTTVDSSLFKSMLATLAHRGPEDEGVWHNSAHTVALGQRRLAIIDLSPGGHQPMRSENGRYVITFNGEIYNFAELRRELEAAGFIFQAHSDTEVLLKAYIHWGEQCLPKLNGMFAFAVWDNERETLFAARDPLGEKPFKYYHAPDRFIFASELKAIIADATIPRVPDWQAVDLALTYRFVPAPRTGFQNIHKLPAGHFLVWKKGAITITPYWQAANFATENTSRTLDQWKSVLWDTFLNSVRGRLISDVPVGTFLSGGLDSSSVVAAMSELSMGKIKTFSVGLKDQPESEAPFGKMVADYFHTDHTEIIIEPNIIDIIPELVHRFEEPFFDNAAVPTMAMAKKTKEFVTVALTGDGGDECFGGYTNHVFFRRLQAYQRLPGHRSVVPALAGLLVRALPRYAKLAYRAELLSHSAAYVDYYAIWKKELPRTHFYLTKADLYTPKLKALVDVQLGDQLMNDWMSSGALPGYGAMNRAMLADIQARLPDDYLMKVDFAGMTYALENRAPFLDPRLVELALSLPEKYKVRGGVEKWIWKEVMKDKLPAAILQRRKAGFGIPIGAWMRGELYEYVREKLVRERSPLYEYFEKATIVRLIDDHKSGKADYSNHLWCLLLTDTWLRTFFGYES